MTPDKLTAEAQSVLDELWVQKQIPFQLTAHQVEFLGQEEYIVRFFDSRLRSVDVSWKTPDSFKDAVRVAILARVARLSGPLRTNPNQGLRLDQRA
jgi:hypothetical protein